MHGKFLHATGVMLDNLVLIFNSVHKLSEPALYSTLICPNLSYKIELQLGPVSIAL